MAREDDLLQAFVDFADSLVDDYDAVAFAHGLSIRCVSLFDIDDAGIMLAESDGALHYLASSSERMRLIELTELQHDEGTCLDAFRSGVAVMSAGTDDAVRRWPHFGPQAIAAGFHSVAAIPMRHRSTVIGAVDLFSMRDQSLSQRDHSVAQALVDVATIGILQERELRKAEIVSAHLLEALDSRVVIEQAKGMLAGRAQIGVDRAFMLMRAYARRNRRLLADVARTIVSGDLSTTSVIAREETPTTDRSGNRRAGR